VAGGRVSGFYFPCNLSPATYNLTKSLPQIESRFPIVYPNLARTQHQRGMTTAAQIFYRLFACLNSHLSNALTA
jgi:hypothetical protein